MILDTDPDTNHNSDSRSDSDYDLDLNLNIWDPTKKYVGKWSIIVIWYELGVGGGRGGGKEGDDEELVLVEKKFGSMDEMEEYMEPLVQDGTVFDIFGTIESSWVEESVESVEEE